MKISKPLIMLATLAGLLLATTSCQTGSVLRTGPVLPPTTAANVAVHVEKPSRPYQVLGLVEASSPKGIFESASKVNQEALSELREQAARLGADAVIVSNLGRSETPALASSLTDDVSVLHTMDRQTVQGTAIRWTR